MDAEKYVKDIVRGLKCTGKKKREIGSQLLSDIDARREQGETLEQIVKSMGTPQEIAEAFRQNLSEADRKAYRRGRIGMSAGAIALVLILLAILVWWMLPKPADLGENFSEEEITANVEKVVDLLNRNDFEALKDISIPKMSGVLTQETIDKVRDSISDNWGSMQSLGKVYMQGIKQRGKYFIVTQVDAIYENVSVIYTISFDKDMRLGGLYIR